MIATLPITSFLRELRTMLVVGMTAIAASTHGQGAGEGLSLLELEIRFEEAMARIDRPVTDLNSSYQEALKRLMTAETEKANLNAILAVKQEIERIGDGSSFDWATMHPESRDHPTVAEMKRKYVMERSRLWEAGSRSRKELVKSYLVALESKEKELTKDGKISEALEARKIRDALARDPRMLAGGTGGDDANSFPAKVHLVAKGEVELTHNGKRLTYSNDSRDRKKYVDGTSPEISISIDDVIVVRMRSTVVYRSFILTIEGIDGTRIIPIGLDQIRYLGADVADPPDEKLIKDASAHPGSGTPDPDMTGMWTAKSLSDLSRTGSAWAKCGPGAEWHSYAIVIGKDMVQTVTAE